jgi:glycosyltransferase involved in cell wall biosynthesis
MNAVVINRDEGDRRLPMRASLSPSVLVISHLFPTPAQPTLGCFVHEQVRALRDSAGVDARVLCCRPFVMNRANPWKLRRLYRRYRARFDSLAWETYQGVPVMYLPYLVAGFFRFWLHGATCRAAVLRALPFLRATFPFELIHAHTCYLDGSAAWDLGRRLGLPYVLTEHTGPFRSLMGNWLVRWQALRALRHAARVWCVSSALSAEVRGYLPPDARAGVHTLHNGVDTDLFRPAQRWSPDPAGPRLLSVLALEENKAPLLLLKAFRRLRQAVPGATLRLIGEGPLEEQMRGFIQDHGLQDSVKLCGPRPRAEVARLMRAWCDLLVLPSHSETFGVVLIEALASGKPVVATRCGGPADIVTEAALGALCPPGDVEGLAGALQAVTRALPSFDPRLIRRRALERFAFGRLAGALATAYRELWPAARPAACRRAAGRPQAAA